MPIIPVADPDDPRIAGYRDIRERDLVGRQGRFIAEGEVVLRVLLGKSPFQVESCFIAEPRLASLEALFESRPDVPIYVAPQMVMNGIAGFAVHRGIMAIGCRPAKTSLDDFLAKLPEQALVVVCCGIANHDNMGGIFRNAAAFGADAVLIDAASCDPLYRKAIRVSVGGALRVPFHRGASDSAIVEALAARGFTQFALSPAGTCDLSEARLMPRTALYLGAEGPGLPDHILRKTETLSIPMSGGFDSINVATTCGIALYHLRHGSV